jgi:hypothetical protein
MYPLIDFRELYYWIVLEIYYQRYLTLCLKFEVPPRDRRGFADAGTEENPNFAPMIRAQLLSRWPGESLSRASQWH